MTDTRELTAEEALTYWAATHDADPPTAENLIDCVEVVPVYAGTCGELDGKPVGHIVNRDTLTFRRDPDRPAVVLATWTTDPRADEDAELLVALPTSEERLHEDDDNG